MAQMIADVTRDSDTTFKVQRSKVKVTRPLYSPLTRQAAAAVGTIDRGNLLLRWGEQAQSARWREALRRPHREERGGAYCGGSCTVCFFSVLSVVNTREP